MLRLRPGVVTVLAARRIARALVVRAWPPVHGLLAFFALACRLSLLALEEIDLGADHSEIRVEHVQLVIESDRPHVLGHDRSVCVASLLEAIEKPLQVDQVIAAEGGEVVVESAHFLDGSIDLIPQSTAVLFQVLDSFLQLLDAVGQIGDAIGFSTTGGNEAVSV